MTEQHTQSEQETDIKIESKIRFKVIDYLRNYAIMQGKPLSKQQLNSARKSVINTKRIFDFKKIPYSQRDLVIAFKTDGNWLVDTRPETNAQLEVEAAKLLNKIGK